MSFAKFCNFCSNLDPANVFCPENVVRLLPWSLFKEICELKGINEQVESKKQAELSLMSQEYENKLSKLQRQKAMALLNQQIPSSHQEIFRKSCSI